MEKRSTVASSVLLLIGWPLISTVALGNLTVFWGAVFAHTSYDEGMTATTALKVISIVISYVLALVVGAYLLHRSAATVSKLVLSLSILFTVGTLAWWRLLSVSLSHLDCADHCTKDVFPLHSDTVASTITTVALIGSSVLLYFYLQRRKV